jgi:glucosamine kinase
MAFLIAVDGGGTSCRAVIADGTGKCLGEEGLAGSANISTDLEAARNAIVEAAGHAIRQAGLPEELIGKCAAVLGLAGANIDDNASRVAALLPFRVSHVETDARIALQGALGDDDGAVAVIGTGSVFIARKGGEIRSVGGWGPVVGDFCSGSRLGRTLLEETLRAYDGLRAPSVLTQAVLAGFGNDPGALVEFAQEAQPRDFASFAPRLFEAADGGDPVACEIIAEAVRHLEAALGVLIGADDLPCCLLGGLASSYDRHLGPGFKPRQRMPKGNALSGALSMAVALFGQA